jgi:hypothetical protein
MDSVLGFWGIGAGAASSGKWRGAAMLGLVCFTLLNAALESEDWVLGGIEYAYVPPVQGTMHARNPLFMLPPTVERAARGAAPLGAITRLQQKFHLGLDVIGIYSDFLFEWSGEGGTYTVTLDLLPFLRNAIVGVREGDVLYQPIAQLDGTKITAVRGLIGTSMFFLTVAWFSILAMSYEVGGAFVAARGKAAAKYCSVASAFFIFVAVLAYDASKAKVDFCKALDPDVDSDGLPCIYSNGFNLAVASICMTALFAYVSWFAVPYEAVGTDGGSGKGAPLAGGYSGFGSNAAADAPAPEFAASSGTVSSAGGYQNFGSPSAEL